MSELRYTTPEKTEQYDAVISVFTALMREVRELSKKKSDLTLNEAKVKIINRVLEDVKLVMAGELEEKYLDVLNDSDLPQFGDALLVMSQHEGALSAFHGKYHRWLSGRGEHGWAIIGEEDDDLD